MQGWKAFTDGEETSIVRANYLLRTLLTPQGEHEVEFRFEPSSYYTGNKISLASSLILMLALAGVAFVEFKKKTGDKKKTSGED